MNFFRDIARAGSLCPLLMMAVSVHAADERVDYVKQIKPLLKARCYACHGALKQEAELRLDTAELIVRGGTTGAAVVPNDSAKSLILERVSAQDVATRMPPENEGEPFSAEQLKLLKDWIDQGGTGPSDERPETDPKDHWAFKPVKRPNVPVVEGDKWGHNAIDSFLLKGYREKGLAPQPAAPREVLVRRLYLDLVGLPPTAAELSAIQNAPPNEWYTATVEKLLADPRYGERWGRHWMDVWRYSDWWGFGTQLRVSQKHIWRWRDWIVDSLNSNLPYDEMLRQMLAADELYPNDPTKLRATGYLARTFFIFNRHQWLDDTVEHFAKGFLGLTANCAKCHDHKYDPIKQEDYYKLRAFFEPYQVRLDMVPGQADFEQDGMPCVYDGYLDRPTYRFIRGLESAPDKSKNIEPGLPDFLSFRELSVTPVKLPSEAWQPERRAWVIDAHLAKAQQNLAAGKATATDAQNKLTAARKQVAELSELAKGIVETPTAEASAADASVEVKKTQEETAKQITEAQNAANAAELAAITAEADVEILTAELASIQLRGVAMKSAWTKEAAPQNSDLASLEQQERDATREARRAEIEVEIAKSNKTVKLAEHKVKVVAPETKEVSEKELTAAREGLEKAKKALESPGDRFATLRGAAWTPTRTIHTGQDDPDVPFPPQSTGRRTALAHWLTDRDNPLTARVAVNHLWSRHLGMPLVPTLFDFGRKGTTSAHPELIDWLAMEFMDSGWDMKHIHRLILNSALYQMSSTLAGAERSLSIDPDNRFFWRRVPVRLESEVVRDSVLSLAGTLDLKRGGPPVPMAEQGDSKRRSLYFFHSNNERNLLLTTFDEASVSECYQREQSIVPQQALALANSRQILDACPLIAARLTEAAPDDAEFIRQSFLMILGIRATDTEVEASLRAFQVWKELPDLNANGQVPNSIRALFVWTLINHNDFVTLR